MLLYIDYIPMTLMLAGDRKDAAAIRRETFLKIDVQSSLGPTIKIGQPASTFDDTGTLAWTGPLL